MSDYHVTNGYPYPRDIKISQFIEKLASGVTENAKLTFVQDGQNYSISIAEFLTVLGTVGQISGLGEVTGVPVLYKDGLTNYIRNLLGGAGILTSLSAENGISIATNFSEGDGVPILTGKADAIPVIRGLEAGTGISISAAGDVIQVALSATPVSNKTVIVVEESDFPTPESGVITLEDDTFYFLTNDITTSNRFVLQQNSVLASSDGTLITLTYSGSGIMFTGSAVTTKLRDILVDCPNGTLLDISGTGTEIFQMVNINVVSCDTIGTINSLAVFNCSNAIWGDVKTDGIDFTGTFGVVSFFQNVGYLNGGTFLELGTALFTGFNFSNSYGIMAAGTTFLSGAADSANVSPGGLCSVYNVRAIGAGTALSGISTDDSLWDFQQNSGIPDSINSLLAIKGSSTVTIATVSVPVIVGATWTFDHLSRFTATAGGRFTYIGKGAHIFLTGAISATGVVPSSKHYNFLLYKNGVAISGATFSRAFDNSGSGSMSIVWQINLETDDYLELWLENTDSNDDLTIDSITLSVS